MTRCHGAGLLLWARRARYQSIAARTTGAQQRSDRRMSAVQHAIDRYQCEQCHVVSVRRELNTTFRVAYTRITRLLRELETVVYKTVFLYKCK